MELVDHGGMSASATARYALIGGLCGAVGFSMGVRSVRPLYSGEITGEREPGSTGAARGLNAGSMSSSSAGTDGSSVDLRQIPTSVLQAESERRSTEGYKLAEERFPYPGSEAEEKVLSAWILDRVGRTYADQRFWKADFDVTLDNEKVQLQFFIVESDNKDTGTQLNFEIFNCTNRHGLGSGPLNERSLKRADGLVYTQFYPSEPLRRRYQQGMISIPQSGVPDPVVELYEIDTKRWIKVPQSGRWLPSTEKEFQEWKTQVFRTQ